MGLKDDDVATEKGDGWVLVPREPTEAMLRAAYATNEPFHPRTVWSAMIAATQQATGEGVPDPACHATGWQAKKVDGKWRVGMSGNLDTRHDATVTVHQHIETDEEARRIAEWIAAAYNRALATQQAVSPPEDQGSLAPARPHRNAADGGSSNEGVG